MRCRLINKFDVYVGANSKLRISRQLSVKQMLDIYASWSCSVRIDGKACYSGSQMKCIRLEGIDWHVTLWEFDFL